MSWHSPFLAYLDPGSLQPLWGSLTYIIGLLAVAGAACVWPLRYLLHRLGLGRLGVKTALLISGGILVALGAGAYLLFVRPTEPPPQSPVVSKGQAMVERVIVIGVDGMDPGICEKMMDAGELPHFDQLRRQGTFARLTSTVPPESPVAWATAASGCNPGQTGIFDYIDCARNYRLSLSLPKLNPSALTADKKFLPARGGPTFWGVATKDQVPVTVVRWPTTFPPEQVNGRMFSGLGTPDLNGGLGNYTFFTTAEVARDDQAPDRVVHVAWASDVIETELPGPMVPALGKPKQLKAPLTLRRVANGLSLELGDNPPTTLEVGAWSPWLCVKFSSMIQKIPGQVKFYLASLAPTLDLYATALQVDPGNPAFAISAPRDYAKDLERTIGDYYTLGMPEDMQAVTHGRIALSVFLQQCEQITVEREKMFDLELARFDKGILACVFDTSDRIQHMTWFAGDPDLPKYSEEANKEFGRVIEDHYRRMDAVLGRAMAKVDDKTMILVFSDHGFAPFRRAVHLNTWLAQNGYLKFQDGAAAGESLLKNVDWPHSRAYAAGFCSLYINLGGRQKNGCVPHSGYDALCAEIIGKLKQWRDPQSGAAVVRQVYRGAEVYQGKLASEAPDLTLGYERGYRASAQTALGGAPAGPAIEDNVSEWSGDHLMDRDLVPGSFFCNRKIRVTNPSLQDIAPTILQALGLGPAPEMDGRGLF